MTSACKKGLKMVDSIKDKLKLVKLDDLQDFYLRKGGAAFAIRSVNAYHITGTDKLIVLGDLQLAAKTAHLAQAARQMQAGSQDEVVDEPAQSEEPEEDGVTPVKEPQKEKELFQYTEDDVSVVMSQGGVSREEAVKALDENEGDPLSALCSLGK